MANKDCTVDMKPNRDLLDPNFDGYKLSLEPLPVYKIGIECDVDRVVLTDDQYSYQHAKTFGVHNHLFLDPYNSHIVFFIDQRWKVMKQIVNMDTHLEEAVSVHQISNAGTQRLRMDRVNTCLSFPAEDYVLLSDGAGVLQLLHSGDRSQDLNWRVCLSESVLGEDRVFRVVDSLRWSDNSCTRIECLLLSVIKNENTVADESTTAFLTVIDWITLTSEDGQLWSVERSRRLEGSSAPDYVSLDREGHGVVVSGPKQFVFSQDSLKPVMEPKVEAASNGSKDSTIVPAYTWYQTGEDVCVQFSLPEGTTKPDILFKLSSNHVELGIKNGMSLLVGDLHAVVDVEGSTWTFQDGNMLELQLTKLEPVPWPLVVMGDDRGEMVIDPAQVAEVHERLAHLTSDTWNPPEEEMDDKPYNSQQLEECDIPEDTAVLARFDGDKHCITHRVNLGSHQWLFNASVAPGQPPCVCLRHDVDGVIWQPVAQPGEKQSPCEHIATFNAFGYVQASKQQKKFIVCSPDFSYVALCECVRHIFVYRQPSAMLSPLRNRKTGREVGAIAIQQLISLDTVDTVMGIQASKDRLFILAGKTLHVVRVTQE